MRSGNRALGYVRRSTDANQEKSLDQQVAWLRDRAAQGGWAIDIPADFEARVKAGSRFLHRVGDVYIDDAISGSIQNRPGLQSLLQHIVKDETVAVLLVWDRSRLARFERQDEALKQERDIRENGVRIVTKDQILEPRELSDGGSDEDVIALIEYRRAAKQRVDLAEGVLRGQTHNAKKGFSTGGAPPYGFKRAVYRVGSTTYEILKDTHSLKKNSKGDGTAIIFVPGDDEESRKKLDTVKFIAEEYARGALGLTSIAIELNRRGIPSPRAGRTRQYRDGVVRTLPGVWNASSVRDIIIQPLYCGKHAWGRRNHGSVRRAANTATGFRKVLNTERTTENQQRAIAKDNRNQADWIMAEKMPVAFEPIIPEELWNANQARLAERGVRGAQLGRPKCSDKNRFALNVVCGDCGKRMCGSYRDRRMVFACSTYFNNAKAVCHPNWVDRDLVVTFALEVIRRQVQRLSHGSVIREDIQRVLDEHRASKSDLITELQAVRKGLDSLQAIAEAAYKDKLAARGPEELKFATNAYEKAYQDMLAAKARRSQLEHDLVGIETPSGSEVDDALGFLGRFDRLLDCVPHNQLRRVFEAMQAKMVVEFAPNPAHAERPRARIRHRIPIRGTLSIGTASTALELVYRSLNEAENEAPPAETGGESLGTSNGCGGWI